MSSWYKYFIENTSNQLPEISESFSQIHPFTLISGILFRLSFEEVFQLLLFQLVSVGSHLLTELSWMFPNSHPGKKMIYCLYVNVFDHNFHHKINGIFFQSIEHTAIPWKIYTFVYNVRLPWYVKNKKNDEFYHIHVKFDVLVLSGT